MKTVFVIKWLGNLVRAKQSSRRGYTDKVEEAKKWTTRARAELFLSRKDPTWASQCVIHEIQENV